MSGDSNGFTAQRLPPNGEVCGHSLSHLVFDWGHYDE